MTWLQVKRRRLAMADYRCEVCGQRGHLIGHHLLPRRVFQSIPDELKIHFCRVRHPECEKEMHLLHEFGNSAKEMRTVKLLLKEA